MKNNIIKLLVLFVSTGYLACTDEIEELQPFTEGNPDTFFNSIATFQSGVNGVYSQLINLYESPSAGMQGMPDIVSDNVILVQTGRRSNQVYYDFNYNPNTGAVGQATNEASAIPLYWSEGYEAVNAANLVIGALDNLPDSPEKDNIRGQLLAARAWAHFELVRVYAQIPTQSANANGSPGVVYLKVEDGDTGDPFAQPARETVQSNYTEIIGDLLEASQLIGTDNGEGRLDRNGVFGLLSRIYLYMGNYQEALDAANEVTTTIAPIDAPTDNLQQVYQDASSAGLVIELAINTATETTNNNVGVLYSQSTADDDTGEIETTISEYAIDFQFFADIDPNDLRRNVIQFVGTNQGNDYNAVLKFLGETGQINGRVDIKVMRAAEVLLNKAEAQFELGEEADALATLDILRNDRYTSFTGGESGAALEAAIQFERRVELCFEGHRFFDLKRRGEDIQRSAFGDIIDGSGTPATTPLISAGDFRFQWPIPIAEINANPNLAQNAGY